MSFFVLLVSKRAIQESLSLSLVSGEDGGEASDPAPLEPSGLPPPHPAVNSLPSYASLGESREPGGFGLGSSFDEQLRMAMELSCREQEELDRSEKGGDEESKQRRGGGAVMMLKGPLFPTG